MSVPTVLEAYEQFNQSEECQANPRLIDNLRTTLRRYVLPSYGQFTPTELKKDLEGCLAQIPLSTLLNQASQLLVALEQNVKPRNAQSLSKGTVTNYRSALLRFFNWIYSQGWEQTRQTAAVPDYAPTVHGPQSQSKAVSEERPEVSPYSLKEEELTDTLQDQLKQLQSFLTGPATGDPTHHPVSQDTFRSYKESIFCLLGWLKNIQKVELESLALEQVTDRGQLEDFIEWG
ncbi:MAG: hypothetical protein ICV77_18360, partial [Cyanobacteria bacterium Co-bin8]|nr:hypothetical protein [Cyanobacteria bacterium Co-bin8]